MLKTIPITVNLRSASASTPGHEKLGEVTASITRNVSTEAFITNRGHIKPSEMERQAIQMFWDTPGFSRKGEDLIIGRY